MDMDKELQDKLINAGVKLLVPNPSTDDLLASLDNLEELLSAVGQEPFNSLRDALLPAMKALVSDGLFLHPVTDVRITVMSCISEVMRITAPNQPFEDEIMKEVFQLAVAAFEKLSLFSGRCYSKAMHILEIVATYRSSVILLDLRCNALVTEIFGLFLQTIKFNHPNSVFSNMAEIMTCLIDESDEVSLDLLKPLLDSLRREDEITSPVQSWLAEKVLKDCSTKVKPCLKEAVTSMSIDIYDYADIVGSLCRGMPARANVEVESETTASHLVPDEAQLCKSLLDDCMVQEADSGDCELDDSKKYQCYEQVEQLKGAAKTSAASGPLEGGGKMHARAGVRVMPNRRGRKANSLIKPEEGYEYSGMTGQQTSHEIPHKKKNIGDISRLPESLSPAKSVLQQKSGKDDKPSSCPPITSHVDSTYPSISPDPSGGRSLQSKSRLKRKDSTSSLFMFETKGSILEDQLKKESLPVSVSGVRTGSGKTLNDLKVPGRCSSRKKSAVNNNVEISSEMKNLVKKEKEVRNDSDEKQLLLGWKDGRKGMEEEDEKSEGFKKPRIVKEGGEELIGSRIKVWWPKDKEFYEGVIDSFDPLKKKHKVSYDDGDQENLNLKEEVWLLLGRSSGHQTMVENETTASHLVEAEAQVCKSLLDDCIAQDAETDDNGLDDRNSSKILQSNEKSEQLRGMDKVSVDPGAIGSEGEMQARGSIGVKPCRRGRKFKPLRKPEDVSECTEDCKKPEIVKEHGEELVGSRIKVWWSMDFEFYEGVIDSFDPVSKKHKVLYTDGDEEILNLGEERWFVLSNTSSDRKKKPSTKNKHEIKHGSVSVSSKRRYTSRASKSGSTSAERSGADADVTARDSEETKDGGDPQKQSSRRCK